MNQICKKDFGYVKLITELGVVKNAVELLAGSQRNARSEDGREEDGEESKEERGWMVELRVKEKIALLELLSGLVKGGMEMGYEEELKEIGMELEEEGNEHVEEEEKEGEDGEEEKREWEELSEKAHQLVWVIKKMKARREGKKSETLRMIKQMQERDAMLEEENAALKAQLERSVRIEGGEGEEEMEGEEKKDGIYRVNNVSEIKLLSEMQVVFGDCSVMSIQNNSICHTSKPDTVAGFIGEQLSDSVHRMFESFSIIIIHCSWIAQDIHT